VLLPAQRRGTQQWEFRQGRYLAENGDIVGASPMPTAFSMPSTGRNGTPASPVYDVPTIIVEPSGGASSNAGIINGLSQIVGGWNTTSGSSDRPFGWNPGDALATDLGAFGSNGRPRGD
jgi:hypothetical protein